MKYKLALLSTLLLNCFDCLLTLHWIGSSRAYELNPLMSRLVHNPVLFCLVKLGLVILGTTILWNYLEYKAAQVSTIVVTSVYVCITLYHVWYII